MDKYKWYGLLGVGILTILTMVGIFINEWIVYLPSLVGFVWLMIVLIDLERHNGKE